jgi:streptogramin lyase
MDWGQPPVHPDNPGPYEFWSVHSIGISRDRRLFVMDREHSHIWVADWTTNRLVKYDLNGRYILDIGSPGPFPRQFDAVHQIHVDQEGSLYLSEIGNNRTQKFQPLPDADPETIVGPQVRGWP